jgi:hypothetical protein
MASAPPVAPGDVRGSARRQPSASAALAVPVVQRLNGHTPQIVPKDQLADHLTDLLFFLFDGPALPLGQHLQARNGIQAFADSAPSESQIDDQVAKSGMTYAQIQNRAPQIANLMDAFFGGYNVAWNGRNAYSFDAVAQWGVWPFPVEDVNAIRLFCVLPQARMSKLLFNLLSLLKASRRE